MDNELRMSYSRTNGKAVIIHREGTCTTAWVEGMTGRVTC